MPIIIINSREMGNSKDPPAETAKKKDEFEMFDNQANYSNIVIPKTESHEKKRIEKHHKKYIKNGLVCFSVDIRDKYDEKAEKYKKEPTMPKNWNNMTTEEHYYNSNYNGLALITGEKNNIIVIDVDDVENWKKFLSDNERDEPQTIKANSGNGGIHYYFRYDEELKNVSTKSNILGDEYKGVDIRNNGGCIYAYPTTYFNNNFKKVVSYEWVDKKSIIDNKPSKMPKWLKLKLLEHQQIPKQSNNIKCIVENNEPKEEINKIVLTEEQAQIFKNGLAMLGVKARSDIKCWLLVGKLIYIFGFDVEMWDEWSKTGENYNGKDDKRGCFKRWANISNTIKFKMGIHLLYSKVRTFEGDDKKEEFKKMVHNNKEWKAEIIEYAKSQMHYDKIYKDNEHEYKNKHITVNTKFLLNKNQELIKIIPRDDNELISNAFYKFINRDDNKLILLGSHMGSGKTQLLIKFLLEYFKLHETDETKIRVLFLTYRQSLALDLENNFKECNFTNYLNIKQDDKLSYLDDKIICSIESLHNIREAHIDAELDDKFDIVILDEINSLSRHFRSKTVGEKQNSFLSVLNYCKNAHKIIACDGDIHDRVFNVCEAIDNNFMYIENEYKAPMNWHLYYSADEYDKLILETVKDNKIYIPCCESNSVHYYNNLIKEKYPDKNILMIYGKMDDVTKKMIFINLNENWLLYDVVITTSTTEAGANFDPKDEAGNSTIHFNKIFGILGKSIPPEAFMQMTKRVRNVSDNENIYILTNGASYNEDGSFIYFDDIKDDPKYKIYDDIYSQINDYKFYTKNIIFNDIEEKNRVKNFIGMLILLINKKGGQITHHKKPAEDDKAKNKNMLYDFESVIYAEPRENDIDELINKYQKTENEKNSVEKFMIKKNMHLSKTERANLELEIDTQDEKIRAIDEKIKAFEDDNKNNMEDAKTKKTHEKLMKAKEKIRKLDDIKEDAILYNFVEFIKNEGITNLRNFWGIFDKQNITMKYDIETKKHIPHIISIEDHDRHNKILAIYSFLEKMNIDKKELAIDKIDIKKMTINYDKMKELFNELDIFTNFNINTSHKTIECIDNIDEKNNKNRCEINKFLNSLLKIIGLTIDKKKVRNGAKLENTYYIRPLQSFLISTINSVSKNIKCFCDGNNIFEQYRPRELTPEEVFN